MARGMPKNDVVQDGDTSQVIMSNGHSVLVDTSDVPRLLSADYGRWYARKAGGGLLYATARRKSGGHAIMHREIVGASPWSVVDHINHDTLDNRRANLRETTQSLNCLNRDARKGRGSRGVYWRPDLKAWRAQLKVNGKSYVLGKFGTREEAEAAVAQALAKLGI